MQYKTFFLLTHFEADISRLFLKIADMAFKLPKLYLGNQLVAKQPLSCSKTLYKGGSSVVDLNGVKLMN